ncbi:MAG: Mur ligase family protein [Pseudomonadota bacterium]|nr:Mur ligase family protein [Pseudomonadota bacterium]
MRRNRSVVDFITVDLKWAVKKLYRRPLIELARVWRRSISRPCFVGVTGSAGKTTTKELLCATLARRHACISSPDTHNQLYDVARTLLLTGPHAEFCVQELGLNQGASFAAMLDMLRPQVGIVTTIGAEHVKAFRTPTVIAQQKGLLIERLPASGLAVLNADDAHVAAMAQRTAARVVTFGFGAHADYRGEILEDRWPERLVLRVTHGAESMRVVTQLCGAHQAVNVLAAIAAGHALGASFADAADAVAAYVPILGRLSVQQTRGGVTFIRDDWKAPEWSLEPVWRFTREARAERKIIILGTISDYHGGSREIYHRALAAALAAADHVVLVGENSLGRVARLRDAALGRLHGFASAREAAQWLGNFARPQDLVLLKGSNADHLGRIALSIDQEVRCWRQRCPRGILCDRCRLLRFPSGPQGATGQASAGAPDV